jgi:hypothetical protein
MATRKNVKVLTILERGNHFLANSPDSDRAERVATANFMETLLHDADAYAGFQYLGSAEVDHEQWHEAWEWYHRQIENGKRGGVDVFPPDWDHFCKDDSRRLYLTHKNLKPANFGRSYA